MTISIFCLFHSGLEKTYNCIEYRQKHFNFVCFIFHFTTFDIPIIILFNLTAARKMTFLIHQNMRVKWKPQNNVKCGYLQLIKEMASDNTNFATNSEILQHLQSGFFVWVKICNANIWLKSDWNVSFLCLSDNI